MTRWNEKPRVGQSVWTDHKNGVIESIDWLTQTAFCNFYDKGYDTLELDIFLGCWDDRLQQWVIPL